MNTPRNKPLSKRLGSALVMTLVIIVLITVVTVGYLASVMLETKTAGASLDQEKAYGMAMIGVHEAMARVRDALTDHATKVSWDNPYEDFAVNPPPFYWSLSPGLITQWSYDSITPRAKIPLFSESSAEGLVNLNRQLADGTYPIIGGAAHPPVSVKWVNLLRDPSLAPGSDNPIVGRYAFWVDDEGAKININTADGTEKYNSAASLGIGSPTEVSLEALFPTKGRDVLKEIVQIARTKGFHTPREILRTPDITTNDYASNVFSVTTDSRSPDLNIFGQPKMALTPILGAPYGTNMVVNGITLRPVQEIYPTPSQLPGYRVLNLGIGGHIPGGRNPTKIFEDEPRPWPLAFRAEQARYTRGRGDDFAQHWLYSLPNYCYINGQMLANYLAGTNAAGRQVQWPRFPGSSPNAFKDKYSDRQIDSIVAQIVSLGSKLISSDYPYTHSSDYPGVNVMPNDEAITSESGVLEQEGCRYHVAPYIFPGWLSDEWVIGMGRTPKFSRLVLGFKALPSSGAPDDAPKLQTDIWLESWLPAAYMGGKTVIAPRGLQRIFGTGANEGALNCSDMQRDTEPKGKEPRLISAALRPGPTGAYSFWANQLLRSRVEGTDAGIDFNGNPQMKDGFCDDPDLILAERYHDPFALRRDASGMVIGDGRPYTGAGRIPGLFSSPFRMPKAQERTATNEWSPGELVCFRNKFNQSFMRTSASGKRLEIEGGISIRGEIQSGAFSDPDPVPLEAIRGPRAEPGFNHTQMFTAEGGTEFSSSLKARHIASVIPVRARLDVPAEGIGGSAEYVSVAPDDPLVNKFPGDWKMSSEPPPAVWQSLEGWGTLRSDETGFRSSLKDPDSYWLPQADCAIAAGINNIAKQTLIPRSARMPNIGYLQYVRTGIIPDDETAAYEAQSGTPFRLLSFAPSDDTANQVRGRYPDWAMLDLLYVPSTLTPFGGSYQAATNLAYYGTFGGATTGRVNPNGAVIYTTDVNTPLDGVTRTLPMQAAVHGIWVNQTTPSGISETDFTGGDEVNGLEVGKAVADYIRDKGPLRMPGEICNIPAIATHRADKNHTRNDLVRQVVGNLTTQGNVFSVWTVGQVVQKRQGNASYGEFQSGDNVMAEVRLRFVVERYLDPGADGVYGNLGNKGTDNVVGSLDDPSDDVNHPPRPRYLYRVISSEEIR